MNGFLAIWCVGFFVGHSLPGRANRALEMHVRRKCQVAAGIRPAVLCAKIQSTGSSCEHLLDDATPSYHSGICIQWCLVACCLDQQSSWHSLGSNVTLCIASPHPSNGPAMSYLWVAMVPHPSIVGLTCLVQLVCA